MSYIPSLSNKRLSIMTRTPTKSQHISFRLNGHAHDNKRTPLPPSNMTNSSIIQAKVMMVLITWTHIQVRKFNIDGDMPSTSQEQLTLYICGVSLGGIYPQTLSDFELKQTIILKLEQRRVCNLWCFLR